MSRKSKGINAERELIHLFWQTKDWAACRIAGSGSIKYPSADVLASNAKRKLAIEAKITKDQSKYFSLEELDQLKEFSRIFGAEPWIAIKFHKTSWFFISIEDLDETKKSFFITEKQAHMKGLSFDEFIF